MNSSASRTSVLGNIRRQLRHAGKPPEKIREEAQALVSQPDDYRPSSGEASNLERFIAKAESERVTASTACVDSLEQVPQQVQLYLEKNGLEYSVALQNKASVRDLNWDGFDIHHSIAADEPIAVSIADLAVAETGSVVFLSAADSPTLLSFLPLYQIVVVRQSQIYAHLEDVFRVIGSRQQDQPRNVNIITGTSGTADIEAKNIRGAHGPRYMHIIVVQDI